ncbi:WhiB family transcriptional regulator [Rhodococcus spongiicola]|uniref:WhiB family transcriptional regulator n=1 Tax=Rhodococcus spongiicola TaxID=2487352 RepID=UPI0019D4E25C|nr:WhiB family transcriptional regulator [Rhodococcus spongiicola]
MSDWREQAACREDLGHDPDWWFPNRDDQATINRAVSICHTCPVLAECRAFARSSGQEYGIWAGQVRGAPTVASHGATHCRRGHEYTPDNTQWVRGGTTRRCRICVSDRNASYRKTAQADRRADRLEKVAALLAQGVPKLEIAERLGMHPRQVQRDASTLKGEAA